MKISINYATIRKGWMENLFSILGRQTFPNEDFELILVDDYGDRWEYVKRLADLFAVNVKYMSSKPWHWKSNRQLGNARNTAFIHCDGELVVFLDDYSWVGEDFLETHWKQYRGSGGDAIIGAVQAVELSTDLIDGEDDLVETGKRDERWRAIYPQRELWGAPPGWFWTFNASAPMEKIVKVNGYDERFDCAGEDDVDLGLRLSRVRVRFGYVARKSIMVYHMRHNGNLSRPSPFKPEECRLFTKEELGVKYDGSWGLMEDNSRRAPWDVNQGYFSLKEARKSREEYPMREVRVRYD